MLGGPCFTYLGIPRGWFCLARFILTAHGGVLPGICSTVVLSMMAEAMLDSADPDPHNDAQCADQFLASCLLCILQHGLCVHVGWQPGQEQCA